MSVVAVADANDVLGAGSAVAYGQVRRDSVAVEDAPMKGRQSDDGDGIHRSKRLHTQTLDHCAYDVRMGNAAHDAPVEVLQSRILTCQSRTAIGFVDHPEVGQLFSWS